MQLGIKKFGDVHLNVLLVYIKLGDYFFFDNKYKESLEFYQKGRELQEILKTEYIEILERIGDIYYKAK